MKLLMIVVMLLCIGAFFIISQNNLHLNSAENLDRFIFLYSSWVGEIFESSFRFTGDVIKMEWLPGTED